MAQKFILFDFDGVIVDSEHIAYGVAKTLCPHVTKEEYRTRFEGNIHEWEEPVDRHTADCRPDLDFTALYVPRIRKEMVVFPGMVEVVAGLARDYALVVVSSTITSPIEEFLDSHDLVKHFCWIMGADVHRSKVEKIKMVFEKYALEARDAVFITDTLGDMREAEKVGVGAIGVTWGFHTPETLQQGKPFRLVETPKELSKAVSDHFLSQV